MKTSVFSTRVLLLLFSTAVVVVILSLALPGDARRCSLDDAGSGRGGNCEIVKRPTYQPPDDGPSPDQASGTLDHEELWTIYCRDQHGVSYREGWLVNIRGSIMSPIWEELYELDPTGTYERVTVFCMDQNHHWSCCATTSFEYAEEREEWINVITDPPDPVVLEENIRETMEAAVDAVPVEPGDMAPPLDAGVVNTPTWLWVDTPWDPIWDEDASVPGTIVWAEAEPAMSRYVVDGEVLAECEGPGTPYDGGPLSTGSDCMTEFEEAALDGRDGTVEIVWDFYWGEFFGGEDYYYGRLGEPYNTSTDVTWTIDEVFSTETG